MKLPKRGAITEEDIYHLQRRRLELFGDIGPVIPKKEQVYLIGENVESSFLKNMNTEQKTKFN